MSRNVKFDGARLTTWWTTDRDAYGNFVIEYRFVTPTGLLFEGKCPADPLAMPGFDEELRGILQVIHAYAPLDELGGERTEAQWAYICSDEAEHLWQAIPALEFEDVDAPTFVRVPGGRWHHAGPDGLPTCGRRVLDVEALDWIDALPEAQAPCRRCARRRSAPEART